MATIVPPVRFEWVETTLMRGAHPREVNYPFLVKTRVKKLVSVCNKDPFETDAKLALFCRQNGIETVHIDVQQSSKTKGKNRSVGISYAQIDDALTAVVNSNEVTFVFCDNGGATTSIVVGCLRKVQLWSSVSISEEFATFMGTISHLERTFLEEYTPKVKIHSGAEWLWRGVSMSLVRAHPLLKTLVFNN